MNPLPWTSEKFSCTWEKYTDPTVGNMEEEVFSEVAVSFYRTARQRILDKRTVRKSDLENLKPHIT
jgi:predicted naringenin-chalcone synthase